MGSFHRLKHLDLSYNLLGDTIPEASSGLVNLQTFYLEGNAMTVSLPGSLFEKRLSDLQALSVRDAGIQGSIPSTVRNATSLRLLNLGAAGFVGSLPDLPSGLEYLLLNCNFLTGTIPSLNLPALKVLQLDRNDLDGSLENVCQQDNNNMTVDCRENVQCSCCNKLCCSCEEACAFQGSHVDSCKPQREEDLQRIQDSW